MPGRTLTAPTLTIPDIGDALDRARRCPASREAARRAREEAQHQRAHLGAILRGGAGEWLREAAQSREERRQTREARAGRDSCGDYSDDPLVTIRIATYNRGRLIAERAIAAALAQTHRHVEVLVVGDCADEATAAAVEEAAASDERVRWCNLPTRGAYPDEPRHRWMVAGAHPMNVALSLARGSWIAPCDDDDLFTPDHVERLLDHARRTRSELVWSRAAMRQPSGEWHVTGGPPLQNGHISHGSVLYSADLRFFSHSLTSWRLAEPSDWNLWRRMRRAGVRMSFLDELTYYHF
jgi:hypothetical protein